VACTGDYGATPGEIAVIDPRADAVVAVLALGGAPGPIAISFDGRACVADSINGVTGYDANTLTVTIPPERGLKLGGSVFDVKVDSMGRFYAALFDKDKVVAFDPSTGEVLAEAPTGSGPQALAVK
jgi:DNA-binding beta-propeller fold protein YncE